MKTLTLLICALLTFSASFSQTTFYTQSFGAGIPAGWTNAGTDGNGQPHTGMWKYTTSGNHSSVGWPTVGLNSPTKANGWIILDSDSLDDTGQGGTPAPQRGYLTSSAINCTGHNRVLLQFYQLYFSYEGNPRVVVSNGTTNDTINVSTDYDFTFGQTPDPSFQQFDVSSVAANQSSVTITFLWDNGYYFYWQVDDISLLDAPVNDLAITQAGSFNYYSYPLSELDSISYYSYVTNIGSSAQPDSRLSLKITKNSSVVFTDTTPRGTTLPVAADSVLIGTHSYLPSAIGAYTSYLHTFSDSIDGLPFDNGDTASFVVSDSVYAAENGVYGGSFVSYLPAAYSASGVAASQEWANVFYLPYADTITSLTAAFDGIGSTANAVVQGNVYALPSNYYGYGTSYNCTPVIQTQQKLITAADMTNPNAIGPVAVTPVSLPINYLTGNSGAAILQPGFYAISITNVNDSLISLVNSFAGAGIYGTAGGLITSGSLTTYSNTHFYLRMNFGHVTCPTATVSSIPGTCTTNGKAIVTLSGVSTGYTYHWSAGTSHSDTSSALPGGQYTVTVTNNLCNIIETVSINNSGPLQVSATPVQASCGAADGSISVSTIGGGSSFNYEWSTTPVQTTQTATGLSAGIYSVTVTSGNCSATASATVTNPGAPAATISSTNAPCAGLNGSVTASTSVSGVTYVWNTTPVQTTATATGLPSGVYTVTVALGACETVLTDSITTPSPITATDTVKDVTCFGMSNGCITVVPSGGTQPYTHSWSFGPGLEYICGLSAGTYSDTIYDSHNCKFVVSNLSISQPTAVTATDSVTNVACFGFSNGCITVTASGGTQPYTFSWTNSATGAQACGLTAGPYSVTVYDNHNCSVTNSNIIVSSPSALTLVVSQDGSSAIATASGGTPGYTYLWSNGLSTDTITNLNPGTYGVTVSDANGCIVGTSITITSIESISAGINSFNVYPNPSDGIVTVSIQMTTSENVSLSIADLTGRKVYESTESNTTDLNKQLDLRSLAKGTYIITLKTDSGSANQRIVLE